jgi:thiosulfate/3-mercaptopyruvate sulfurtransferase
MSRTIFLVLALVACTLTQAASPRDNLLVSPAWLATHVADPDLVLLHIGEANEYSAGHIPGARLVEPKDVGVKSDDGLIVELPSAAALHAQLQALGVSDRSRVVVYSTKDRFANATRFLYTLDAAGFRNRIALLDGGLAAWEKAGQTTTDKPTVIRPGTLSPLSLKPRAVDAKFVEEHLQVPGLALVDARAGDFYNGVKESMGAKGRLPGAKTVEFSSITTADGTVKSPEELAALFASAGVKPGDDVVAYCHVGVQATAIVYAAWTLGINAKLYDGSFQEWSKRGLPIVGPPSDAK